MIFYNVDRMLRALQADKVTLVFDEQWSEEERLNYIIHMFSIVFVPQSYVYALEAAEIAYRQRKWRGQEKEWRNAWKPNK